MKQMRFDSKNNHPFQFPSSSTQKRNLFVKFAVFFLLLGLCFRLFSPSSVQFSSETADPSLAVVEETTFPPPADDSPVSSYFRVNETQDSLIGYVNEALPSPADELPVSNDFPVNETQDSQNATTESVPSLAVNKTLPPLADELPVSHDFPVNETKVSQNVTTECNIFIGHWVPDPSGPYYTNESCRDIEAHQNCMKNGRPDSDYLYWRWQPRDCELPKFDPQKFLNLMRDKSWAFIGDSISRNHVQSLLCTLSQVEQAVEVYHDKEYRSKRWHFPSHNFTLSVIWTPFLVKAAIFEDINGVSSADVQLHLDKLDTLWTKQYENFDYVIIAGGKWFLKTAIYYENNTIQGCHNCPGKNLTELGFDHAYRKALQLIFKFVTSSNHKARVFFRTTTPDHFENGEWFSGGYCNRTTAFKEGELELNSVDTTMRNVELEEFEKAAGMGSGNGTTLKLLDTTILSLLRPDGHPGVYRQFQPYAEDKNAKVQNDCLHWCLPGPIDSWNELVMKILLSG